MLSKIGVVEVSAWAYPRLASLRCYLRLALLRFLSEVI